MNWTKEMIPDLSGKVIIVTGGNSGIGFEAVKAFAEKGAEVVLAARTNEKGLESKQKILMENPDAKISEMVLELTDLGSVREFAKNFLSKYNRLDILLNNAGIMMTPYNKTRDGFESQIGTNHLGHFALTALLIPLIKNTAGSRVVNISSLAHKRGTMDFDNFMFENKGGYTPIKAYGRSKIANLFFTYELQRRFESEGINSIAVAAHPGISMTNLGRYLTKKIFNRILWWIASAFLQEAYMGALPGIRAAVDPSVKGGEYYGPAGKGERKGFPVKVESNELSHNREIAQKLWDISEKLTGVEFKI